MKNPGVWTERSLEPGFPASFANPALDPPASSPPLTQGWNFVFRLTQGLTFFSTDPRLNQDFLINTFHHTCCTPFSFYMWSAHIILVFQKVTCPLIFSNHISVIKLDVTGPTQSNQIIFGPITFIWTYPIKSYLNQPLHKNSQEPLRRLEVFWMQQNNEGFDLCGEIGVTSKQTEGIFASKWFGEGQSWW